MQLGNTGDSKKSSTRKMSENLITRPETSIGSKVSNRRF